MERGVEAVATVADSLQGSSLGGLGGVGRGRAEGAQRVTVFEGAFAPTRWHVQRSQHRVLCSMGAVGAESRRCSQ